MDEKWNIIDEDEHNKETKPQLNKAAALHPSSSADGSPSVDIDVQYSNECGDLVTQKIHFVKG